MILEKLTFVSFVSVVRSETIRSNFALPRVRQSNLDFEYP